MSIVVSLDALRKCTVKVTPSTLLQNVLNEACTKLKLNLNEYALSTNNKEIDLTLPFRLSGLSQNQKINIQRKKQTDEAVHIAVQLPNGDRVQCDYSSSTNLITILNNTIQNTTFTDNYFIQFMNKEISVDKWSITTLNQLGLSSGTGLLRLIIKSNENNNKNNDNNNRNKSEETDSTSKVNEISGNKEEINEDNEYVNKDENTNNDNDNINNNNDNINNNNDSNNDYNKEEKRIPEHRNIEIINNKNYKEIDNEDVPDNFYELTQEDIYHLMEIEKKKQKEKSMLLTKKMREATSNNKMKYEKTVIKIRFPSEEREEIKAEFLPEEKIEDVINYITPFLKDSSTYKFNLIIAPPVVKLENNKTLIELGLVPSAVLQFISDEKRSTYLDNQIIEEYQLKHNIQSVNSINESIILNDNNTTASIADSDVMDNNTLSMENQLVEKNNKNKTTSKTSTPKWFKTNKR